MTRGFVEQNAAQPPPAGAVSGSALTATALYLAAFVTGAVVMSFEMLGSRYLNPYFGSGIYTWAALISTVLAALTVGYFLGGFVADRMPSAAVLGLTVVIGSLYLLALPAFAEPMLEFLLEGIDDVRAGSLVASLAILMFPVTFLGMYSPFAIRLLLVSAQRSGVVSGTVYGVSTAGSIVGTLGTTFVLIPMIGTRAITLALGVAGLIAGLAVAALPRAAGARRSTGAMLAVALMAAMQLAPAGLRAEDLLDAEARAAMLKRPDGRIARIESEYNDIFITKRRNELTMSFQLKGWDYTESVTNLADPDDLPLRYAQAMSTAVIYPQAPKKILMLGLGGGSLSTYLGRFMPDVSIDTVELDRRVIEAAQKYFGLRETGRVRYFEGDGRVFLNRHKALYDLILLDAYRGGYVPFHLLTKEFYLLVKQRLAPGGAVASNVHDGSKLYAATVKTLTEVFSKLDLYPTGVGEVIAMANVDGLPDRETLARRAEALQQRYGFRFPLPRQLERRIDNPQAQARGGTLLTDDFAPVNLYDTIGRERARRK
jgi:spermidine synthase